MSLQIPSSPSRPVSAAVSSSSPASRRQPPQHRASHQVVSSTADTDHQQPAYTDVYSHPAAVAYAAAHPRRTIPKFGPYLLLQTLGEGEFGKVKLGLHSQWGEEVAVKLIRRGNVDTAVRMSKVEREIEVLRTLKHPNIVRLYDVIETDKYIGIIIEYASGGELFDHILAHRYLRERDASKLFSQLISGVWYIHQKKIVHRDLKLENLLLDRHRNVIITDFGFANRFEHRADDLMQTSCGSPCYAAPELVISEGLYVGSAVDIWSCGVILYAMLAGYLPFDDDPANPDGDNINLLYKYIVNTPLSFPEYISEEARGLLKMMLVPDPRRRASLSDVMRHPWLAAYHLPRDDDVDMDADEGPGAPPPPVAFGRTVDELERAAMEQHQQKRLAYQRQMRSAGAPQVVRAQTTSHAHAENQASPPPQRSQSSAAPEFLYDSAALEDPFGPVPGPGSGKRAKEEEVVVASGKGKEREEDPKDKFRHTIQIEYEDRKGQRGAGAGASPAKDRKERERGSPVQERRERERSRTPTQMQTPVKASTPAQTPVAALPVPSPPPAPASPPRAHANGAERSPSVASIADRKQQRRRGSDASGKPLPPSPTTSPPTTWKRMQEPAKSVVGPGEVINGTEKERPSVKDVFVEEKGKDAEKGKEGEKEQQQEKKEVDADAERKDKDGKKSRRNTLTSLVIGNPINSFRGIGRPRTREPSTTISTTPAHKSFDDARGSGNVRGSSSKANKVMQWIRKGRDSLTVAAPGAPGGVPSPAESVAAESQSQSGASDAGTGETTSPVQVYVTTPSANAGVGTGAGAPLSPIVTKTLAGGRKPSEATTPVSATTSGAGGFASRFRRSVNIGGVSGTVKSRGEREPAAAAPAATAGGVGGALRIHHGAVDQGTITTGQPPEVMRHVKEVLGAMGVEIFIESEYKYRCIRAKQRRSGKGTSTPAPGVAAFTMSGSAGSNGVDKRGLPLPSPSSFSGGGMLRGLLMRRQSSQVSNAPGSTSFDADDSLNASAILTAEPGAQAETVYGTAVEDAGDEVRFSVELTRLDRLNDTYSLDIRRLKGNLRSYKFLYDTLRKRADLQR
ncbi:CAMK/CAMKL/Kin4 protein kinase [Mycena olivaceomarginata]|nr:CAMK/CAMKL/Kin4 protein kinase [Mycena olivaceomarginata]